MEKVECSNDVIPKETGWQFGKAMARKVQISCYSELRALERMTIRSHREQERDACE